ncbi:hypothetical protein [Micromonospora sp. NPDC001898]|uniref:hypothetical protein n=1 Tax=Micromonospora sp. NPDC001898 TaxID=3364221 RepID=UPI0036BACC8D
MYILIGEQQAEAVDADEQRARFAHMADVVRRSPGFVRGWWGLDDTDREAAHVLIALDTLDHARALRRMVEENVTGVRLRIMEVGVSAEAD